MSPVVNVMCTITLNTVAVLYIIVHSLSTYFILQIGNKKNHPKESHHRNPQNDLISK